MLTLQKKRARRAFFAQFTLSICFQLNQMNDSSSISSTFLANQTAQLQITVPIKQPRFPR